MQTSEKTNNADTTINDSSFSLRTIISRLTGLIAHLSPGDVAELRRGENVEIPGRAFWRIFVTLSEHNINQQAEEWQSVLAALAFMNGLHNPKVSLGSALSQAGYSEARLTKLLNAHPKAIRNEIATAARFLSAKGQSADLSQLAALILKRNNTGQLERRLIAKDFYSNQQ